MVPAYVPEDAIASIEDLKKNDVKEKLKGRVERIGPAMGSEFAVIKPDNATGNFTKVVQRLPVRISIDDGQDAAARLRPGMSAVVSIETRGR